MLTPPCEVLNDNAVQEYQQLARKRKRSGSPSCVNLVSPTSQESSAMDSMPISRDAEYYFEDGSCILLVESTLFNVHRSVLSKDDSLFKSMLSLPQGDLAVEGCSDDNPIHLAGQTVSEFRNFLWALYALPFELHAICGPGSGLTRLIDIARVSNKFSMTSLEIWALDTIQETISLKASPLLTTMPIGFAFDSPKSTPPPEGLTLPAAIGNVGLLTNLIRLAAHCEHERLLNTMVSFIRQLMASSLEYAYLAMSLSDELDIRILRGSAYLEIMQKPVVVRRNGDTTLPEEGEVDSEGRLVINAEQRLRILSGYYRLTRAWEDLRGNPPPFDHSPSCGATWHQHGCTQSWLEFWRDKTKSDAVLALGLADVIGRLRQVAKDYDRWGSATYMHHDCRLAARRSILETVKQVEEELPDYFLPE